MARTKAQKEEIAAKLAALAEGASSLVFVNIHGLKVKDATVMRQTLRKDGVGLYVSKKTLAARALDARKYAGIMPILPGEIALAYGADAVAPARGVYEFQKKLKDAVAIVGGVFEGSYKNREEMTAIAAIPPMPVLRGMFVNVINSPIQGLVMALDQIAKRVPAEA